MKRRKVILKITEEAYLERCQASLMNFFICYLATPRLASGHYRKI